MPAFSDSSAASLPIFLVDPAGLDAFITSRTEAEQSWLRLSQFEGRSGQLCLLPAAKGGIAGAAFGLGAAATRNRGRFQIAGAAATLPEGDWHIESPLSPAEAEEAALGWLLAAYRFDRYKKASPQKARLKLPKGADGARLLAMAEGEYLTRDLINTPASDMGPAELEEAAARLASQHGASLRTVRGDDLIAEGFPMIHAVGRASARTPRLLDMRWGKAGPRLTLVGKGVCFDTGGLDLKPSAGMLLMKKDMGGAATVLGLAHMIMALGLDLRLRVLIPAVENAVAGDAMRPKDILTSRKGLTVEINNTDAEGRLVLADALALADEEKPEMIISMATLTGAARVAVGPDLAPFYSNDEAIAAALASHGSSAADPVWRMPLWPGYESVIEPDIADLDNAPGFGFAGSITAALFLHRFVTDCQRYAHFDIYCWQPTAAPGRPKGGVGQGARATLGMVAELLTK
ncbi:MAG: leucyl aminopeptidase family protein [Paracoccaceae bacterium]